MVLRDVQERKGDPVRCNGEYISIYVCVSSFSVTSRSRCVVLCPAGGVNVCIMTSEGDFEISPLSNLLFIWMCLRLLLSIDCLPLIAFLFESASNWRDVIILDKQALAGNSVVSFNVLCRASWSIFRILEESSSSYSYAMVSSDLFGWSWHFVRVLLQN